MLSAQSLYHTIVLESESVCGPGVGVGIQIFSAAVGVWSPNFSNPGVVVGVSQKYTDSASLDRQTDRQTPGKT